MKTTETKNIPNHTGRRWFTREAEKSIRKTPEIRRAIEDHYSIKGYNTVNVWLGRRSEKLLHPAVLKTICEHLKKEESEILITIN